MGTWMWGSGWVGAAVAWAKQARLELANELVLQQLSKRSVVGAQAGAEWVSEPVLW